MLTFLKGRPDWLYLQRRREREQRTLRDADPGSASSALTLATTIAHVQAEQLVDVTAKYHGVKP